MDVNARQENTQEWTGLHICAKSPASVEVMTVRVANGADPNPEDGKGYTALDGATAGRARRRTRGARHAGGGGAVQFVRDPRAQGGRQAEPADALAGEGEEPDAHGRAAVHEMCCEAKLSDGGRSATARDEAKSEL